MELVRLDVAFAQLGDVARAAAERSLVLSVADADTVMCAASLRAELHAPIGVWLEISADYPAQLAARDVATLSWLVELDQVVVSAVTNAAEHAEVVRALLTNDEVNLANDVATIVKAYNRPAPPRDVRVWSWDGAELRSGPDVLALRSTAPSEVGEVATFA